MTRRLLSLCIQDMERGGDTSGALRRVRKLSYTGSVSVSRQHDEEEGEEEGWGGEKDDKFLVENALGNKRDRKDGKRYIVKD